MTSIEWLVKELKLEGYDHTIKQAKEMHKQEMVSNCSQVEISDEEIWAKANEIGKINNSSIVSQYLYEGAKWYREQLKQL